jgi:hypothetical protein
VQSRLDRTEYETDDSTTDGTEDEIQSRLESLGYHE